jgi:[calcium/calmodulin-dependent protein kinase] kinase
VLKLIEVISDDEAQKLFLVLEFADGGALAKGDEHVEQVPLKTLRKYMQEIVSGLEYMHSHGVMHRDIKPENILIKDGVLKLADFGTSLIIDLKNPKSEFATKAQGTAAFMCPEMCNESDDIHYSMRKADIWALGITLYQLVYGDLPFTAESLFDIYDVINNTELVIPNKPKVDNNLVTLIKRLLDKDSEKRITMEELLQDPWLTDDGKVILKPPTEKHTKITVTKDEVANALTPGKLTLSSAVKLKVKMHKMATKIHLKHVNPPLHPQSPHASKK